MLEVIDKGWSVRQLEADMRESGAQQARDVRREGRGPVQPTGKDADTKALEKRLSDALGLAVTVLTGFGKLVSRRALCLERRNRLVGLREVRLLVGDDAID